MTDDRTPDPPVRRERADRLAIGPFATKSGSGATDPAQTSSLSDFSRMALTALRAGLALMMVGSLVNGLMPGRALVAGLLTILSLSRPGTTKMPGPFLPRSLAISSLHGLEDLGDLLLAQLGLLGERGVDLGLGGLLGLGGRGLLGFLRGGGGRPSIRPWGRLSWPWVVRPSWERRFARLASRTDPASPVRPDTAAPAELFRRGRRKHTGKIGVSARSLDFPGFFRPRSLSEARKHRENSTQTPDSDRRPGLRPSVRTPSGTGPSPTSSPRRSPPRRTPGRSVRPGGSH